MYYSEDDDLIKTNCIKTYLHIHNPTIQDKPYYKLDLIKNILYLNNNAEPDSEGIFEFDKIFTNENNNSYIYENICSNIIKEALEGKSYCFISYGTTMSDKLKVLIGDFDYSSNEINIENKGIFMNTLEDLINNKNINNNINISLSYFSIYNDKIIDLSLFQEKDLININNIEENLMKKSIELNKNYDINILQKIDIINNNSLNSINYSIIKLFNTFLSIEDQKTKYHMYPISHFCFIIYIKSNDNVLISSITFILLNGSELLNKNFISKKSSTFSSLISVDSQFIYNSIIYSIQSNKVINSNIKFEKDKLSKLTSILNDICFKHDKNNIKFRVIGNILPITGYYENCKDTLMFLFNIRQNTINKNNMNRKGKKASISLKDDILRDDVIFDLESKIKFQADTIENLNKIISRKEEKLFDLEKNYKIQIEYLKKYFGFNGKIEVLLTGDVETKEYKEAQKIREAIDDINILKKNIKYLEKTVTKKEEIIDKLKKKEEIKYNDETMIRYYLMAQDIKKNKKKENENKKDFFEKINLYENEIKNKDIIINNLNKELEQKNKILLSIPKIIKKNIKKNDYSHNEESEEVIEIKKYKKNKDYNNDLLDIIQKNKEEYDKMKKKYDNIISQLNHEIKNKIEKINEIRNEYQEKFNKLENEIVNFILNKNKNINDIDEYEYEYPNIFKLISSNKKFINKNKSKKLKKESLDTDNKHIINDIDYIEKMKSTVINFDKETNITFDHIKNYIKSKDNILFSYDKNQLEQLSKENLITDHLKIINYNKTLEDYIDKYDESKEKINNININNIKKEIKKEYEDKLLKLKNKLNEEIIKNNNNLIVINSQQKLINNNNIKNSFNYNRNKSINKYPLLNNERCNTITGDKFLNLRNNILNTHELNKNFDIGSKKTTNRDKILLLKNMNNSENKNINIKKRPFSSNKTIKRKNNKTEKHVTFDK